MNIMTIYTNSNILFTFGSIFVGVTIVSLIELAYVFCVLERKNGATEHRLRTTEQNLQQITRQYDALVQQLKDVKLELLSTQCDQLAKNRLIRREIRLLRRKLNNAEEIHADFYRKIYKEVRNLYKRTSIIEPGDRNNDGLRSAYLQEVNMRFYNRDIEEDLEPQE